VFDLYCVPVGDIPVSIACSGYTVMLQLIVAAAVAHGVMDEAAVDWP
jgi:hypothetical protein